MARGDWLDTYCSSCGTVVHYHRDWDRIPDLCSDCLEIKKQERAKWHETTCDDCGTVIRYHQDWNRVPDLCKPCLEARKAKWQEKSCTDCGTTIRYHVEWDRIPDLCKNCREERRRKREEAQAKWHEKNCLYCNTVIKYHQDWQRIPDYCRECNTPLFKVCAAQGCYEQIRYKKYWNNIPEYCRPCKTGERAISERRMRSDGGWDEYTGWGYVNRNGVIVFVDDGPYGKHSHTVYDSDGNLVGERAEGYNEEFIEEEEQEEFKEERRYETTCKLCRGRFFYHPDQGIPELCADCREGNPRLNTSHEQGLFGEYVAEEIAFEQFRFEPAGYDPPLKNERGIDRIYRNGNNIVIVEAKSVSGYAPSSLHDTQKGPQMSKRWIEHHASNMLPDNKELGNEILAKINGHGQGSIRRIIINTDPTNGRVRCYEALDLNTNTWTEIDPFDG